VSEEPEQPGRERPSTAADRRGKRVSPASTGAGAVATPRKGRPTPSRDGRTERKPSVFSRLVRFIREVVAELRKVIWPGRRELITYTTVVIIFVAIMVAIVAGLDLLFAKGVIAVFG